MENMNQNTTGTRKKLLVPLVVLLLCAVSFAGVAYAYSSSVTVVNNTVTGEEYVLEVYDGANVISAPLEIDALRVYSETKIGDDPNTVTVKAENYTDNTYSGKLTLKDSTVTGSSAVRVITFVAEAAEGSNMTVSASEITSPAAKNGEIGYTVVTKLYLDDDGTKSATAYDPEVAIAFENGVATLWYEVTINATAVSTSTGIVFENNTPQTDVNAVMEQLAKEKYVLKFTAQAAA